MKGARRVDLVRLSEHLSAQQRHPELVKAIARAAAAGSIRGARKNYVWRIP